MSLLRLTTNNAPPHPSGCLPTSPPHVRGADDGSPALLRTLPSQVPLLTLGPSPASPARPQVLHQCLVHPQMNVKAAIKERDGYMEVDEMYEPLR